MKIRSTTLGGLAVALGLFAGTPASAQAPDTSAEYQPLIRYEKKRGLKIELPLSVRARGEGTTSFVVDADGTELDSGVSLLPQARIGALVDTQSLSIVNLHFEYEHDVATGVAVGSPDIEGVLLPNSQEIDHELRKLYLRASMAYALHLQGGVTTSHWGLGLLANDGAHGWTPGSAYFSDPRSGDRVIRGQVATGPLSKWKVAAALAVDRVLGDDILFEEDDATQFIGALQLGRGLDHSGGIYLVRRDQTAADGRDFGIWAVDGTAKTKWALAKDVHLEVEGEIAFIFGDTNMAASPDFPTQDILQLGAAARAKIDFGGLGGVLDFLYASGDQNFDDQTQNAFKADPNYEMGLLLFRQVLAAQTGRAVATASDPDLVGRPSTGLERYPTRGGASNTIAVFPRGYWEAFSGFEVYGGPLFAWTEVDSADPLNSRVEGGAPTNALGGDPGSYLGTELDLGVRYQTLLMGTELQAGLEGGVLFPGPAFNDVTGASMDSVFGARLMLSYRL